MYTTRSLLCVVGALATLSNASPVMKIRQDTTADAAATTSAIAGIISDIQGAAGSSSTTSTDNLGTASGTTGSATTSAATTAAAPSGTTTTITWAQPSIVGSVIPFGNLNPSSFIATDLASACADGGCPMSGSTTAFYAPTPSSTAAGATVGTLAGYVDEDAVVKITWTITSDIPDYDISNYLIAMAAMQGTQADPNTFTYQYKTTGGVGAVTETDTSTLYQGLNTVGIATFINETTDNIHNLTLAQKSMTISFQSEFPGAPVSCSSIEGPIAAALGLIPEIGPFFGIIGGAACSAASA